MKTFGLTTTTGNVEGEVRRFGMTETGTFTALPNHLDMTAWDAMSDDEKAAICADVRTGGFGGWQKYAPKQEGE
jgi:hypothetical protein